MPQGRRKVPFSGKAKKQQMQAKKNRKTQGSLAFLQEKEDQEQDQEGTSQTILKVNQQPIKNPRFNPNRYVLQFHKETKEELKERAEASYKAIVPLSEDALELSDEYFHPDLSFPKRPSWDFNMTKQQLDAKENKYYTEYINDIEKKFDWKKLSYFEMNLETWRQLWRVIEMSDILLIIVDIRFPALMFPPSLYEYITQTLKKDFILILNKIDLCPPPLVLAWKYYFKEKYPELHILMFTSFARYNLRNEINEKEKGLKTFRRRGKPKMAAEGAQKLLELCKTIVNDEVDLTSWSIKIKEEMENEYDNDEIEIEHEQKLQKIDTSFISHEKYKDGVLTIGCIGQPNVGKSSLINALMGKKVVSVSKTPGHTKHFQTIYLTSNVRLCDCPGLIFPSTVPKNLQVLMGSFPISQIREPFSAIQFIAERMDLPKLLNLQHPQNDTEWSSRDICDAWAKKRGFYTAKAARLDSFRAANNLLRLVLEGRLCICLTPPKYTQEKDKWISHEEISFIEWIQASQKKEEQGENLNEEESSEEDETQEEEDELEKEVELNKNDESSSSDSNEGEFENKFSLLAE